MAQKAHKPTEKTRAEVMALAGYGIVQEEIALYIGVTKPTLHKYYRQELDLGKVKANAAVARALFKAGVEDGSVSALIFWLKAQAGWSEKVQHELTGRDGKDLAAPIIYVDFSTEGPEEDGEE